jgi:hypothetical protein
MFVIFFSCTIISRGLIGILAITCCIVILTVSFGAGFGIKSPQKTTESSGSVSGKVSFRNALILTLTSPTAIDAFSSTTKTLEQQNIVTNITNIVRQDVSCLEYN